MSFHIMDTRFVPVRQKTADELFRAFLRGVQRAMNFSLVVQWKFRPARSWWWFPKCCPPGGVEALAVLDGIGRPAVLRSVPAFHAERLDMWVALGQWHRNIVGLKAVVYVDRGTLAVLMPDTHPAAAVYRPLRPHLHRMALHMALALDVLCAAGAVHGSLDIHCVHVDGDQFVLADMGLQMQPPSSHPLQAPEVIAGDAAIPAADMWSLGCMLLCVCHDRESTELFSGHTMVERILDMCRLFGFPDPAPEGRLGGLMAAVSEALHDEDEDDDDSGYEYDWEPEEDEPRIRKEDPGWLTEMLQICPRKRARPSRIIALLSPTSSSV